MINIKRNADSVQETERGFDVFFHFNWYDYPQAGQMEDIRNTHVTTYIIGQAVYLSMECEDFNSHKIYNILKIMNDGDRMKVSAITIDKRSYDLIVYALRVRERESKDEQEGSDNDR